MFAHLCVLAGAGRNDGISNVVARLASPDHRAGRAVITQTRNTFGMSNTYGAYVGRTRPVHGVLLVKVKTQCPGNVFVISHGNNKVVTYECVLVDAPALLVAGASVKLMYLS